MGLPMTNPPPSDADVLAVAKELGCDRPYWGGYSILEHGQIIPLPPV